MDRDIEKYNSLKARFELGFITPKATAKNINYMQIFLKFICIIFSLILASSSLFISLNYIIYLSQNILKLFLLARTQTSGYKGYEPSSLQIESFPIYSILVPMYKEGLGVKAIIYHLNKLDYPQHLLDIKLVIEEDDEDTLAIATNIALPNHITIIKVPYSEPRTKPKAMNYAMQYIRGEYVVIYDVEDRPEPDQLIKALATFRELPEDVICLQAKLRFYNHDTNLLAKLFHMEYQIWFDFLLPAIDIYGLPIPLGGNSNHFRVRPLIELGLWDAYNVTEDADLGIRIYTHGFKTKIIDSYSFEEAPTDIKNWLHQRSRWIKGFIQSFLVYLGQSKKTTLPYKSRAFICMFFGFSTYSFLAIALGCIIYNDSFNIALSKATIYMTFFYMYYSAAVVTVASCKKPSLRGAKRRGNPYMIYGLLRRPIDGLLAMTTLAALVLWPFYFLLHTIAAYKALWELVKNPFSWNKTAHAISTQEDIVDK